MSESENTKRIARNTAILYIRMLILMLIGLFTSRVVLNTLGVSDYGIYNVVGGVVTMFGIVTSALSSSVSRFLTFEIGRKDTKRLQNIFSISVALLFVLSIIMLILMEIIGVWFLNYHMNIPANRMAASNFVLQCSIISFVIILNSTPYNAAIIAHEKMSIFAYITMFDAIMKLVVVYLLYVSSFDRLKVYALLLLFVSISVQFIYFFYCKYNFSECKFKFKFDADLIKAMGSFSVWGFFGNASWIINTQGINILINIFFGVTINAARGIATQVDSAVQGFVTNFTTALNPQIIKSYASGDLLYMHKLVFAGARYSFFLMLFFFVPISLETHQILFLWLKQVPAYTVNFVRFSMLTSMMMAISSSLTTGFSATGHIKKVALMTSIVTFLDFPFTYVAFVLGASPTSTYIIYFLVYFLLVFIKVYLAKNLIKMSMSAYFKEVLFRCCSVAVIAFTLPLIIVILTPSSLFRLIVVCLVSVLSTILSVVFVGMRSGERIFFLKTIRKRLGSNTVILGKDE